MKWRPPTIVVVIVLLMLTTVGTGCFGIFGSGGGPEESALIIVRNDLDPPDVRTIRIRPSGEDEATLGTVPGASERTFTYKSEDLQGAYQLVAPQASGASLVSREFTLFSDARVRWDMRTNAVTVSQSR